MPTIEEQHLMLPIADKKYWYINIEENTATKRYYLYAEIIIPIFNNGTTYDDNNIYIRFMNTDFATIDSSEYSNLDKYSHSKLKIEFDSPLGTSQYSKFSYNTYDFLNSKSYFNNFDDSFPNSNINENFRVISLMILPELNKPDVTIKDNSDTDYSTLLLFINGRQFTFSPNTAPLPLYKFYNGDDAIAQIVVETDFSDTGYDQIPFIIWNTAYDKFVYQDLANMCYKEYAKSIMNVNSNIKYPLFDSNFKVLVPEYNAFGLYLYSIGNTKSKITIPSSNGFVFYKVFKLTKTSTALNVPIRIDLINLQDDSYNVFNEDYAEEYSFLNITDSIQEQIVRTANYNFNSNEKEKYLICYLRVINNNQVMFGYGNTNDIEMNFDPTQETVNLINNNYYSLRVKSTNVSYDDDVQIEDISYSGDIPYPTDITTEEKNSLFMSPNNYHWKSLWKYNRTIEYSSPLQDNPVILPLNVFTDDENENMFIEFIISPTSGTISDWGISLFDTGQFTGTSDNNAVVANSLFLNNGIEYSYRNNTLFLNIVQNNSSIYQTNKSLTITSSSKFAFMMYYNSANKKLIIKDNKEGYKEITEISKDILRNIYSHMTTVSSITINFGPTSDYFQDYIDEILDQDNREDEVDISSDAEVDGVPSYTFETYPYSQATYNVVITIKPPFIAPEDAAKLNESDYLIFSNSNLASYQYSYGVYNTDNMRLGYTLVLNRTHVPESTTEDVKKNNTDIIQISSSDGKYNYKITLKTIDILKQGYFRFTSFDVPHTNLADLGEAAGQHSFSAVYNLYFESNISKYFITTSPKQWSEIISNTTIKAIGETSSSEATIIKNIEQKIEYVDTNRYINGRIEFKVNSQDMDFDQFNFRFIATYRLEELGIETTITSPVITINGGGEAVTLNDLGIGDNYVTDGSYKLLIDHSGSGSKQYSVKFRIKINNAPDDVSTSDISLLSWEVLPSNTIGGLTFINSARILPTLSSWDSDTGYMSGYVSLTVNNYSLTGSYTFNLTISYKNDPNNTATGSFGFDFGQKIAYAAIPSGEILQLNGAEAITDEVLDSTLFTIIEHSYDSNNSVIYVANDDQYILEHCPVNIRTLTTLNKPKAKATITFTLQDRDIGYMDTIIEKYVEGFYTYNMTIDLEESTSSRIINGNNKTFLDSFTVNKLSSSKFEVIMTCTKTAVDDNTFKKGTGYLFSSYSTLTSSLTGFGSDVYLALMRAKVDTKLEFTIIGDYYA